MQKKRKRHAYSKRLSKKKRRQRELMIKIGSCVVAFFIIVYIAFYQYVNKTEKGRIHDNILIGEVNVSGMTAKEAVNALNKKVAEYEALAVTIKMGEASTQTTLKELGFSMNNLEDAVKKAVDYGKKGSVWKRFWQIWGLGKEEKVINDKFQIDADQMTAFIDEYVQPLELRAQNATIHSTGSGFEITDEVAGTMVNTEESIEALNTFLNKEWSYEPIEFEMQQSVEEPEIKRADLEVIQDELGSYYTDAGSGTRLKNIQRAAELLNGMVLAPGQEVSVEKMTAPYTIENGYVEGSAYENGQVVQSIGGGLCQVSTTLYNAILYAELEIVTRSAHSMLVSYVEPSRDAAIAEGVKDLIFKNNYEYPVLIESYINGAGQLWFHVYGKETRPSNRRVEYISETLEEIPYTKKFVADSEMSLGEKNTEGSRINGKTAKLWKVVYEDGVEVSRETKNNSYYRASELTVRVGTASANSAASQLIKNAVSSQDEEKINAAISEAKALESAANEPDNTTASEE